MPDPIGLIPSSSGIKPLGSALTPPSGVQAPGFKDALLKNLEQVNAMQKDAQFAIEDLAAGKRGDVDGVMIAKQKADVAFQMLVQVRNTLMEAYDEVKQIRV